MLAPAPAGRLDKPEWLLSCVLRLARELGPHLDFLQVTARRRGGAQWGSQGGSQPGRRALGT